MWPNNNNNHHRWILDATENTQKIANAQKMEDDGKKKTKKPNPEPSLFSLYIAFSFLIAHELYILTILLIRFHFLIIKLI